MGYVENPKLTSVAFYTVKEVARILNDAVLNNREIETSISLGHVNGTPNGGYKIEVTVHPDPAPHT